jgi:hypothetical protein
MTARGLLAAGSVADAPDVVLALDGDAGTGRAGATIVVVVADDDPRA